MQDVERLAGELPNLEFKHLVEHKEFNHGDYIFAKHAKELLYNGVLETMNRF